MPRKAHNDNGWYGEERIVTIPRFKESGRSVHLLRKGMVLAEKRLSDIATATRWLAWGWVDDTDLELQAEVAAFPVDLRDQPGCPEKAVTVYGIKRLNNKDQFGYWTWQFSSRRSERGDADMEDQNSNYNVLSAPGPRGVRQADVSESIFLGVIDLTGEEQDDAGRYVVAGGRMTQ